MNKCVLVVFRSTDPRIQTDRQNKKTAASHLAIKGLSSWKQMYEL